MIERKRYLAKKDIFNLLSNSEDHKNSYYSILHTHNRERMEEEKEKYKQSHLVQKLYIDHCINIIFIY